MREDALGAGFSALEEGGLNEEPGTGKHPLHRAVITTLSGSASAVRRAAVRHPEDAHSERLKLMH